MKTHEFNRAIQNMLMAAYGFKHSYGRYYWSSYNADANVPRALELGSTPLNESILVLNKVAQKFREEYRIEVLNTVILTDGDASHGLSTTGINPEAPENGLGRVSLGRRTILEDRKTRHQIMCAQSYYSGFTNNLLEMYKHLTGSRVVGIYLMSGRNHKSQVTRKLEQYTQGEVNYGQFDQQWRQEFTKHKYIGLKVKGYDVYYMVPGSELSIEEMDMEQALGKVSNTKNGLLRAFKKMQNNKMVSRVFLNQFVKQVA
jgi:hypothetical protein